MTEQTPTATTGDLIAPAPREAAPPAPQYRPIGFPTTPDEFSAPVAVAAREEIKGLYGDRDFYKQLKSERERGVSGPASQRWDRLHKVGWPSAGSVASEHDVARQADARQNEQWDSYLQTISQSFNLTENMISELREGKVHEGLRNWAEQEKSRLVKDRGFYRKLLDGDRAAREEWTKVQLLLSMRPVKDYVPPHFRGK